MICKNSAKQTAWNGDEICKIAKHHCKRWKYVTSISVKLVRFLIRNQVLESIEKSGFAPDYHLILQFLQMCAKFRKDSSVQSQRIALDWLYKKKIAEWQFHKTLEEKPKIVKSFFWLLQATCNDSATWDVCLVVRPTNDTRHIWVGCANTCSFLLQTAWHRSWNG